MQVFIVSALLSLAAVLGAPLAPALEQIDLSKLGVSYYEYPDFNVGKYLLRKPFGKRLKHLNNSIRRASSWVEQ